LTPLQTWERENVMRKGHSPIPPQRPVARVVHTIFQSARAAQSDGPSSGLFGRDAQLSGALSQATSMLAKLDKHGFRAKASPLQRVLGAFKSPPPKKRRSWFFGASSTMPDAKRIEQVLRSAMRDARPLVLDQDVPAGGGVVNDAIDCHLPADAADPVCRPR
jgi:hypothetical protein